MAANDALPVPIRNQNYRVYFALRLNTGALNSGAASLVAKVSKDGNAAAATTNSPIEIATSTGMYYLDLLAAEMNARSVVVIITSSTSGAVPRDIVLYPHTVGSGDIAADVESITGWQSAATAQSELLRLCTFSLTVDSSTYTPTNVDFETSYVTSRAVDFFKGRTVIFSTGALISQAARITGSTYTVNNKIKLTVSALTAAPANGVAFYIV